MEPTLETPKPDKKWLWVLGSLVLAKLLIHLLTNAFAGYGIFRDELYYLACSHRLDLGYVDQPPLLIYLLSVSRTLFGDSLFALRLLPAFAGAASVWVTGLMVKKLGGRIPALVIAGLSMIVAPIFLAMFTVYSMNSIDILLWTLAAYIFLLLLMEEKPSYWLLLGLVIGLGLLNKISMLWFAFGLFFGLLLSPKRRSFTTRWPYIAGMIAFALFLPFIIWNLQHNFAHLEFIRNASADKYANLTPIDFLQGQLLLLHPLTVPVWLAGLYYYFINKTGRLFRPLAIIFVVTLLILVVNWHSKPEYLAPAFPILLAAGGVQLERLAMKKYFRWVIYTLPALLITGGIITTPLTLPCLPVEKYISYSRSLGFVPDSPEAKRLAELPQFYADMFGWQEMARTVSAVYAAMPPEDKGKTVVYAQNYGQAGAIEYFSRGYELPPVVCPHNNYWLWWRREQWDKDARAVIIIGGRLEDHLDSLLDVKEAGLFTCRFCMPYENNQIIYIGRGLKRTLQQIWLSDKHYE